MDRVSVEFHKNVLLLTKFITPHDEFKKHFKEGMFDQPNTLGFIHVSYFLLSVHYKDSVKNKVQWPVICKQTENKFRNDVRECLLIMANENSDLNFPPIFASHLLLARGTKFILIMWKFSLVVLRTYIGQEHQCVTTINPKPGPCQEITKTFLKNVVKDNQKMISNVRMERECIEKEAKAYQNKKIQEQSELKLKILKMRETIKEVIFDAPCNDTAKKRLVNIDDHEIILLWHNCVSETLLEIEENNQNLRNLNNFITFLNNIVLNLTGDSKVLDGLNFDRINVEPIYKLVPPEMQVLPYDLYSKDSLNLTNFFSLFKILLKRLESNSVKQQLHEFTNFNTQLQISNKDLRTAINYFETLHEQIVDFNLNGVKTKKLSDIHAFTFNSPDLDNALFMPSPSIQINNYTQTGRSNYPNDLQLTPVESSHKQLFSRHKKSNETDMNSIKLKMPSVQRINFDDTMFQDTSSDKRCMSQPRTPTKLKASSFKNINKYARIFTNRKFHDNKVNNSIRVMMSSTGNSMIPLLSSSNNKQHCFSLLDSTHYNSSQEFSQEPLLMNPNFNSTIKPTKTEEHEKVPQKSKRRSIGDLVERYEKILQKRNENAQANNSESEPLAEETVNVD